ncbi:MAG: hypothetical protein OXC44_02355, partial [Proteobacteria bacterium]|nr:hypothetical protein [Pseudomonadota bacterium]
MSALKYLHNNPITFLWIVGFVMVSGCKHKKYMPQEKMQVEDSQLQAVRDENYILALKQNQGFPEDFFSDTETYLNGDALGIVSYSFLTCKILKATAIQNRYYRRHGNTSPGAAPYHPAGYIIDEGSCVPAYTNASGQSFMMIPMASEENRQAQDNLTVEIVQYLRHNQDKENWLFHVAAFGTGATFNIFSQPVRGAFNKMIPATQNHPWMTFAGLIGVSLAPTQYETYDKLFEMSVQDIATDFAKVRLEQQAQQVSGANGTEAYVNLKPSVMESVHKYGRTAAEVGAKTLPLVGSGVAGYLSARMTVSAGARLAGPRGAMAGQLIVPFMSSLIIGNSQNTAQEMLDLYEDIMTVNNPETFDQEPFRAKKLKKDGVARVGPLLAMVLTLSGWAYKEEMYNFCLPADDGGEPQCEQILHN